MIAAITSCTNTSNPSVLIGAGLLARNAAAKGLKAKPWVKTSLAPGSQVVAEYLANSGLQTDLDKVGFNLVGFGCTTCIGNSGPLPEEISKSINDNGIVAAAVLSGNRNFEGRVSPDVQANYLASPPLVVAYALAGTVTKDLAVEPIGTGKDGKPVYLKDIWPTTKEINAYMKKFVTATIFKKRYADVFKGDTNWRKIKTVDSETYRWNMSSTYVQNPPYFEGMKKQPDPVVDVVDARILAMFGDKITTDHISPAGSIKLTSPAGKFLSEHQVRPADFNQYGTRRGNHEIMMRGTFANIRIKNFMLKGADGNIPEGGLTKHWPDGEQMSIYDAAMKYQAGGRAAGGVRRRRIRQRLVARLGREGHPPARRPRRDLPELRAHPSLQPGRHGRVAAHLRGRHVVDVARPEGRREGDDPGPAGRPEAASDADGGDRLRRWRAAARAAAVPHRYARRARVLPERRHSALCAAQTRGLTRICDQCLTAK